jgi:hypothetical protein
VARRPDPSLPRCPVHPDGTVRREGTYGKPPRPRYRCFYTDAAGHDHSYVFDFHDDSFLPVNIPGALDVTATGINDRGEDRAKRVEEER